MGVGVAEAVSYLLERKPLLQRTVIRLLTALEDDPSDALTDLYQGLWNEGFRMTIVQLRRATLVSASLTAAG